MILILYCISTQFLCNRKIQKFSVNSQLEILSFRVTFFMFNFMRKASQIKHAVGLRLSQKDAVMLLLLYNFEFDLTSAILIKHIITLANIADKEVMGIACDSK